MVTERITHIPLFRKRISVRRKLILSITVAFLFFISISTGFSAEKISVKDKSYQSSGESFYIIPDQSHTPFKFGVAITPDHDIFPVTSAFIHSDMNQLRDNYLTTQHANVSTVVRIALDEFQCFSGINNLVQDMEKTMNCYTRKFMLTGELNLDPKNIESSNYIKKVNLSAYIYKDKSKVRISNQNYLNRILRQFEINKLSWNMGFNVNRPGISFKIGIGEAFMIHSSASEDFDIGAMIKLSL